MPLQLIGRKKSAVQAFAFITSAISLLQGYDCEVNEISNIQGFQWYAIGSH